jgi:hypothetical protein
MPILALTRLKLKSARLLPKFVIENEAAVKQLRVAKGFIAGKTLAEPNLGMWTTTLWDNEENMRAYYISGAHKDLMPKLVDYACEAVTTHIDYPHNDLPSWAFSHEQLTTKGRFSTILKNPTPDHQNHVIAFPKITIFTRPIKPKR